MSGPEGEFEVSAACSASGTDGGPSPNEVLWISPISAQGDAARGLEREIKEAGDRLQRYQRRSAGNLWRISAKAL